MELVVSGRKRDNKSVNKNNKSRNRMQSPKASLNTNKTLKRIKSSAALY